eukprot:Skav232445  [mRNA]  locus=scaffold189:362379:368147:- [translate_table: standard]
MFLCHDPETAQAAAARAAARTADRAGAGSCCDVICAEERHRRHQGSLRLKQQLHRPALEAKEKPPAPDFSKDTNRVSERKEICIFLERAEGLPQADFLGTADPYVEIVLMSCDPLKMQVSKSDVKNLRGPLSEKTLFKATSRIIRGSLTPQWQESFYFSIPEGCEDSILYFRILDYDLVTSDDFLGHCSMSVLNLGPKESTALEWNRALSAGGRPGHRPAEPQRRWRALRDPRLAEAPVTTAHGLQVMPAPGQESTYDLSSAKLFFKVSLTSRCTRPLLQGSPAAEMDEETAHRLLAEAAYNNDLWSLIAILSSSTITVNALSPGNEIGEFRNHTALLIACLQKHCDLAMALVDVFEASLVICAPGGRSVAMCACEARQEALAEWLISEGVPADLRDAQGRNVLFYAVKEALPQLTAFLLGCLDDQRRFGLHHDTRTEWLLVIRQQRLSPMSLATDGSSPLALAVSSRQAASVVVAKQLLEAKARANCADRKGNFPLHQARSCVMGGG